MIDYGGFYIDRPVGNNAFKRGKIRRSMFQN